MAMFTGLVVTSTDKAMAQGSCNCGAVVFETDEAISDVYVCHCSICRRYTGSNGIAVVISSNENFRWVKGEDNISTWTKPVGDWQSTFCKLCGSSLPVKNDESTMAIPAGSISQGGDALKVAHHIWVESKAAWDEIGDSGKQHPESFKA